MKEHHIPDTGKKDWRTKALDWVDEVEELGFYCEAMREHIESLDKAGFDPEQHRLYEWDE